jgi:KUP system potassium uptake protein
MVAIVALVVWRLNALLVLFLFLVFASLDGVYLSSALIKVPSGAWFTLVLALVLSSIFILWRFGKENQWSSESKDRFQPSYLLTTNSDGQTKLTKAFGGRDVSTIPGVGIFFDKVGDMVPIVFTQFVSKFAARPEITVFFHMRPLSLPTVPESERYVITRTSIPSCYRLTIRHGYTDQIVTPDLGRMIVEQIVLYITRDKNALSDSGSATSKIHSPEVQREINAVESAWAAQTVYVMGKEQMKIKRGSNILRRGFLWAFLWIRENSRAKMADMDIPTDQLVEMGFVKEI